MSDDNKRAALRAERDAIERRQYADVLRLREIRAALAGLGDEWAGDGRAA